MTMESLYEYGARAGVWRVLRLFDERNMPLTVFGVAMALARNPAVVDACVAAGHEIASHGWRWISYQNVDEDVEREHIARAVETIARLTGAPPAGWYTGRDSPHTRRLSSSTAASSTTRTTTPTICRTGPTSRHAMAATPHLVVPYTLDTNDMRFATAQGFNSGDQFFAYLRDAFDTLYAEGDRAGCDAPKMMSVGLHAASSAARDASPRSRVSSTTCGSTTTVWIARRIDIARHWIATHPAVARGNP